MHLHHRDDVTFLPELSEAPLLHATTNYSETYTYNPSGQPKPPTPNSDEKPKDVIGEALAETAHEVNPEDGSLKLKDGSAELKNGWDVQRELEKFGTNAGSIDAFTEGLDIADAAKKAEINEQLKKQYGVATGTDNLAVAQHNGIAAPNDEDGERKGAEVLTTTPGDSSVGFDVQDGDSITDLVRRLLGGKEPTPEQIQQVVELNELDNSDQINVGQKLVVPATLLGNELINTDNLATQAKNLDELMTGSGAPSHVWDPKNSLDAHVQHAKDPEFVKRVLSEMTDGAQQESYKRFVEAANGGVSSLSDAFTNSDVWKHQKPKPPKPVPDAEPLPVRDGQPNLSVTKGDGVVLATGEPGKDPVDTGARIKPPSGDDTSPVLEYWDADGDRQTKPLSSATPDADGYYEYGTEGTKVRISKHEDGKFWLEQKNRTGGLEYTELKAPEEAKQEAKPDGHQRERARVTANDPAGEQD